MSDTYKIHDNGSVPFVVVINDNEAYVKPGGDCDSDSDFDDLDEEADLNTNPQGFVHKFIFDQLFIGESGICSLTKASEDYGEQYDGNTILLQTDHLEYIWIGGRIIRFTTEYEITEFESPIGSNDVPYPWARDSNKNIYLIIEEKILPHSEELEKSISAQGDPYYYFYGFDGKAKQHTSKNMNITEIIHDSV